MDQGIMVAEASDTLATPMISEFHNHLSTVADSAEVSQVGALAATSNPLRKTDVSHEEVMSQASGLLVDSLHCSNTKVKLILPLLRLRLTATFNQGSTNKVNSLSSDLTSAM
jgi:hypothetical protein